MIFFFKFIISLFAKMRVTNFALFCENFFMIDNVGFLEFVRDNEYSQLIDNTLAGDSNDIF